ncbi:MAG: isochorismatase family protein [Chthonomonas sp.]|nr:isochorismatase family protein [Chthonomonas sp.]
MALAHANDSVLMVVDLQPSFMAPMPGRDEVVMRARFLVQVAAAMNVPILATEQVPARMGHTDERILEVLPATATVFPKTAFSAWRATGVDLELRKMRRKQVVLVGAETHICVTQTAHDLIEHGFQVVLATDAITGRGAETRRTALQRMAAIGCIESHTESVTYEWLESSEHAAFKTVLGLVKAAALSG